MSGKTVDTDSLASAANALSKYIGDVKNNIQKMVDAAQDCSDNMDNDVYSQNAIKKLQECIKELNKTINEAESLRNKILAKKREIENSTSGF